MMEEQPSAGEMTKPNGKANCIAPMLASLEFF